MSQAASPSSTTLHGRLLLVARLTWLALMIPTVVLSVLAQIELAREPLPDCTTQACEDPFTPTLQDLPLLEQEGLTFLVDGLSKAVFAVPLLITFLLVAVVAWRRFDDWVALLVTFSLASVLGLLLTSADDALLRQYPALDTPVGALHSLGILSWVALAFVFPNGRLSPHRPRLALTLAIVMFATMFGGPLMPRAVAGPANWLGILLTAVTLIGGLGAQVYRYRHVSDAVQRQQTRWILLGFTGPLLTFLLWFTAFTFFHASQPTLARVYFIAAVTPFLAAGILVFPLAIAFSVLRYRLWEIDVVINRTLVYITLTIALGAAYLGSTVVLQTVFRASTGQESDVAIAVSTYRRLSAAASRHQVGFEGGNLANSGTSLGSRWLRLPARAYRGHERRAVCHPKCG